ncbi:MAG: GNAT family N-acetyltransferase [Gemmatimonadales bacterium]|nr:GNAT family N-acetyltransferase [Gemmatimonadales bacterium]
MSLGAVAYRPATAADLEPICRLLVELTLPTAGVGDWLPQFTVAELPSGLVGTAGVETYPDGALLRSVAVHPSMQGAGLGRTLTEAAITTARIAGAKEVYLLTTTAAAYFPRLGFTEVDRSGIPESVRSSVEFREACPASAIAMHLALPEA